MDGTEGTSLQSWVDQDPRRRGAHIDFGSRWVDPAAPESYRRLSWVPSTGELYVTDADESFVRVVAVAPSGKAVAKLLDGWGIACATPDPWLPWIDHRLAESTNGASEALPAPDGSP